MNDPTPLTRRTLRDELSYLIAKCDDKGMLLDHLEAAFEARYVDQTMDAALSGTPDPAMVTMPVECLIERVEEYARCGVCCSVSRPHHDWCPLPASVQAQVSEAARMPPTAKEGA